MLQKQIQADPRADYKSRLQKQIQEQITKADYKSRLQEQITKADSRLGLRCEIIIFLSNKQNKTIEVLSLSSLIYIYKLH